MRRITKEELTYLREEAEADESESAEESPTEELRAMNNLVIRGLIRWVPSKYQDDMDVAEVTELGKVALRVYRTGS